MALYIMIKRSILQTLYIRFSSGGFGQTPRPKESLEGNEANLTWQVNYVGKSINLYKDAGYELSGSSFVINKLLGTTWLWDRVRVSGGAYGGFSDFDHHTGLLTFLSYRDPNLLKTVSYIIPCEIQL